MGTIENIGVKSTRMRALSGEEIIISNSNLTASRIRNYRRMNERRIEFNFRVSHSAQQEQLKKIPVMIRKIIEAIPDTRFDRAHFKEFSETGLIFEAVYFVTHADFNKYMDIQQQINFEIRETLLKENVDMTGAKPVIHILDSGKLPAVLASKGAS